MSKWDEGYFWFCDKCGAIAPKLDLVESEFQLFDNMVAHHLHCNGRVNVLRNFIKVEDYKKLSEPEMQLEMSRINEAVQGTIRYLEKEKRELEALRNRPRCPKCGSFNFVEISTASRLISVAAWGLASGKIGKQYECKNCRHKW